MGILKTIRYIPNEYRYYFVILIPIPLNKLLQKSHTHIRTCCKRVRYRVYPYTHTIFIFIFLKNLFIHLTFVYPFSTRISITNGFIGVPTGTFYQFIFKGYKRGYVLSLYHIHIRICY